MRRLKRGLKPLSNFKRNLTALSSWYSIYTSAIAFIPELTQKLYVGLWLAFISSCLLPFKLLGFFIGVYAGIKFFVIDFLFKSCPKLRQRFDTPFIIWTHLPTDLQLKERGGSTLTRRLSESEQVTLSSGRGSVGPAAPLGASRDEDGGRYSSTKRGAFHEVFNLQESERPLTVCESGWRCCLINRDRKSPTDYIRNGYLYVTENHLCFESSSSRSGSSKRNKVIKLADITDIQKYKVLSVLPGSGSGISIATPSTTKASHASFSAALHDDSRTDLNEVYMYAAWHGWAVPMFLFLAIVRLSLNYLIASLFIWVQPELTQKLYVGVYAGIKFFVIDFLFKSCPKLRQRFDTPFIIWTHLPTDLQLKERGGSTLTRRLSESEQVQCWVRSRYPAGGGSVGPAAPLGASRDEDGGRYSSTKRGAFPRGVQPAGERARPLTVCESGWRCCLINRDRKSPTDYIRNGYLYVTENSSSRSGSSKRNKVIKLADITDIQKYKVLSVLPGSGSGISIATPSTTKVKASHASFSAALQDDSRTDLNEASHASFSAALHDDSRTDLNEVKGHLEIALLEKHFL
ncbi:hypothetical protein KUCAC02_024755, partial [Chaenocephalus aceratus]